MTNITSARYRRRVDRRFRPSIARITAFATWSGSPAKRRRLQARRHPCHQKPGHREDGEPRRVELVVHRFEVDGQPAFTDLIVSVRDFQTDFARRRIRPPPRASSRFRTPVASTVLAKFYRHETARELDVRPSSASCDAVDRCPAIDGVEAERRPPCRALPRTVRARDRTSRATSLHAADPTSSVRDRRRRRGGTRCRRARPGRRSRAPCPTPHRERRPSCAVSEDAHRLGADGAGGLAHPSLPHGEERVQAWLHLSKMIGATAVFGQVDAPTRRDDHLVQAVDERWMSGDTAMSTRIDVSSKGYPATLPPCPQS